MMVWMRWLIQLLSLFIISGLSHAGDEHTSSLPDSATYSAPGAPRFSKFPYSKTLAGFNACVVQERRLNVATALGHPKPIGAGCPLGEEPTAQFALLDPLAIEPNAQNSSRESHIPH